MHFWRLSNKQYNPQPLSYVIKLDDLLKVILFPIQVATSELIIKLVNLLCQSFWRLSNPQYIRQPLCNVIELDDLSCQGYRLRIINRVTGRGNGKMFRAWQHQNIIRFLMSRTRSTYCIYFLRKTLYSEWIFFNNRKYMFIMNFLWEDKLDDRNE